jgi:hypothetical protein
VVPFAYVAADRCSICQGGVQVHHEVSDRRRPIAFKKLLAIGAVSALAVIGSPLARAGATTLAGPSATPVIFDTDMYSSADDAGAEAALFAYNLMGQDNVIALGVNTRVDRPEVATDSWKCVSAIAQFYGYPNVPVGSDMPDNGPSPQDNDFIGPCASHASANTAAPAPAVQVYRNALVNQPNHSVVIVCTGYEENIDALLNSPSDGISPLDGAQLVAQKVSMLVMMGGGYPSRDGENNFEGDAGAARDVADNWPTKIVYSGYEVGSNVFTGETVSSVHPSSSPVRAALEAFAGESHPIMSYDMTAAYHAIDPADAALTEVGPGSNAIDTFGANTFTAGTGNAYYLSLTDATGLEASIETLWDTLPGTTNQHLHFTSTAPSSPYLGQTYHATTAAGTTGNPVTLTIDAASTSGCTVSPSGVVTFAAPPGTCVLDANEPGSTTYAPGFAQQSVTVSKIPQTVSFTSTAPATPKVGDTYHATASGGSGSAPVVLTIDVSSTSGCTIDGTGKVTFSAPVGNCIVDANQAGDATHAPAAQVQQVIGVGGDPQTISFTSTAPSDARVAGAGYTPTATATSGLPVTLALDPSSTGCSDAAGVLQFTSVGTCVVDATQAGNTTYLAAPATHQEFDVGKGLSEITVTLLPPASAQAGQTYTPTATSSSGDPVLVALGPSSKGCGLAKGVVQFRAPGNCVVTFSDPGSANYDAAQGVRVRTAIVRGHLHLTASASPATAKAGARVTFSATSSVGYATGSVTFSVGSTVLCTAAVVKGVASCLATTHLAKGTYSVVAAYSGSTSFYAARAKTKVRFT